MKLRFLAAAIGFAIAIVKPGLRFGGADTKRYKRLRAADD